MKPAQGVSCLIVHTIKIDATAAAKKSVLVSGVGIAGPTLAHWLTVHGFKTTLVEIAPHLRTGGYKSLRECEQLVPIPERRK